MCVVLVSSPMQLDMMGGVLSSLRHMAQPFSSLSAVRTRSDPEDEETTSDAESDDVAPRRHLLLRREFPDIKREDLCVTGGMPDGSSNTEAHKNDERIVVIVVVATSFAASSSLIARRRAQR